MKNSTSCPKIGIKIHETNNDYKKNPFEQSTISNNKVNQLFDIKQFDLNIDNYSMKDIFNLFNVRDELLDEKTMKEAKKFVLKTHPDKSGLESSYFLFYSSAYKKLYSIYEFQNKSFNKKEQQEDFSNESNNRILENMFNKNESLKEAGNFNNWFNKQFEKMNNLDDNTDTNKKGYGDWLKSNEDLVDNNSKVTKSNMMDEFEKHKKKIQSITKYEGVNDMFSSTFGATLLGDQRNYTSGSLFSEDLGYTDLKQAYQESVIPITEDDYNTMPKYKNMNEYKTARDSVNVAPISKEEAMQKLFKQQKKKEEESIALAFQLAKQNENAQKKQQTFWGELKQITGL
jgi:hypothetical protein|uniref:J domain-containing protein n=1 Tax=viral metagenome TaxID=1070528 RepID=A0A6C0DHZ7_9ZZZZ